MLWDLIQQVQLSEHRESTLTLERRVRKLEKELHATKESLHNLTSILESRFGEGLSRVPEVCLEDPEEDPGTRTALKAKKHHARKTRDELLKERIQKARQKRTR